MSYYYRSHSLWKNVSQSSQVRILTLGWIPTSHPMSGCPTLRWISQQPSTVRMSYFRMDVIPGEDVLP